MRVQSYIRAFDAGDFTPVGSAITAKGTSAHLVEVQPAVVIPGIGWAYPTTGVNYIRTTEFAPTIKTAWGFIDPSTLEPEEYTDANSTSITYRAHASGVSYWWDGGAWAVAGSTDWNTLADFNANLPTLNTASLAVEARLETTHPNFTPSIASVKLRWTGKSVATLEEWLYRGIVKSWKENIRPVTRFALEADGSGSYDLASAYTTGNLAGFEIDEVLEVFNVTADSAQLTDLLSGYAGTTATLTAPQPVGNVLHFVASYTPLIAITTDADFTEQEKSPAILVTSVTPENDTRTAIGAKGPHAIDRTLPTPAGTVFKLPIPLVTYGITLAFTAPLSVDLLRLTDAFLSWLQSHPTLHCPTFDDHVRVVPGLTPEWATEAGEISDVRSAAGSLRLLHVPCYASGQTGNSAPDSAARVGPIDAGDPDFPGDGYGVGQVNVSARVLGGTGTSDTTI